MSKTSSENILNILEQNNLTCFNFNKDKKVIFVSDYFNDDQLYLEMDALENALVHNKIQFKIENEFFYLK